MNNATESGNHGTTPFDIETGATETLRAITVSVNEVTSALQVCMNDSRETVIKVGSACCFVTLGTLVLVLYGLGFYSDCPHHVTVCNKAQNEDIKIGNSWLSYKECKTLSVPDVDQTNTYDAQYGLLFPVHGDQVVDMPSGNLEVSLTGDIRDYFHEKFDGFCSYGIYKNTLFGSRGENAKSISVKEENGVVYESYAV